MIGTHTSLLRTVLTKTVLLLCLLGFAITKVNAQIGLPPVILVPPLDTIVLNNGNFTLTVTASSLTTMGYQWYKDGTTINGATASSYSVLSANASHAGTYYVVVTNVSGSATSLPALVVVLLGNDIPVAGNDRYTTLEDAVLNVAATNGVLANDSDSYPGSGLLALLVSNPTNGTVTLNTNGSFTYVPAINFNGTDAFTYKAWDGTLGTVEENTTGGTKTEVKSGTPGSQSFQHGTSGDANYMISKIVLHASRRSGKTGNLTFSIGTGINSGTIAGSVINTTMSTISNQTDGASFQNYDLVFSTPVGPLTAGMTYYLNIWNSSDKLQLEKNASGGYANGTYYANGADSHDDLVFSIQQPVVSSPATVTIDVTPVNDAPIVTNVLLSVTEDASVTLNVLAYAMDVEGSRLALMDGWATNGSATIAGTNISFVPPPNFNGTSFVAFAVSDGALVSTGLVTVIVVPVNDRPVAVDDNTNTLEDVSVTIRPLINDYDLDSPSITITSAFADNGTATVSGTNIIFKPATNFNGTALITYTISDGSLSATGVVIVAVLPVNDPPVARDDIATTLEDTSVRIDVLANDSDVEGPLLIQNVATTNGTATVVNNSVFFTPAPDYYGTVVLTYTISDGTNSANANVTVTVVSVNDGPPDAKDDTYTTLEDTPLVVNSGGVLVNDADPDGDVISVLLVKSVSHGTLVLSTNGTFTYTPATNFNGTDSFTYRGTDGIDTGNVATVTIDVTPVNDPPIVINDGTNTLEDVAVTIDVLANDSDVEGPLMITSVLTTNGTAVVDGTNIIFTPATNYNGIVPLAYTVSDGTNSKMGFVFVTVAAVYDPVVAIDDSTNTLEDTSVTIKVLANDYNPDRLPLTISVGAVANGTAVVSGTNIVFTPASNYFGTTTFNYAVSDGTNQSIGSVTVAVTAVNDVPVAVDDAYTTLQDVPLNVPAPGILGNDTDLESASLTAVLVANPSHGTLTLRSNGSFTYVPDTNYFGADSFTYRAFDGSAQSATKTVSLTTLVTTPLTIRCTALYSNGATLELNGPVPTVYTVLASTNSRDWFPISTNVALTNPITLTDWNATQSSMRFYQARMGAQATTVIEENPFGGTSIDIRATRKGAQSFKHGAIGESNYTISKIVLSLSRTATVPNTNFNISIGTGINSGTIQGSIVSLNPSVITNTTSGVSFQTYEVVYSTPLILSAGITYYVNSECEAPNGGRIYFETSILSSAYSSGTFYRNSVNQGEDAVFQIWGQ